MDRRDLMQSAYYKDKLPQYSEDIRDGRRIMATTYEIRKAMLETIAKYGIKEVYIYDYVIKTMNLLLQVTNDVYETILRNSQIK